MPVSDYDSGSAEHPMLFIVGNSRSGTTMLGRILGSHSKVHTFGELHFFEQMVGVEDLRRDIVLPKGNAIRLVERLLTRARDGFFADFSPGKYRSDAEQLVDANPDRTSGALYWAFLSHETRLADKVIPCEQTPRYLFVADELLARFPGAYIINMVRDPRDVVLSQRAKWKRRFLGGGTIPLREAIRAWCNYHPWLVSRLWVSCVDQALSIKSDRFMSIRFEDLLEDPESELDAVCKFIGIDFDDRMLTVPQVGSSSGRDDPNKRGINKDRAAGWRKARMRPGLRLLVEWVCRDRMQRFGYGEFLHNGRFSIRSLPSIITLPAKLVLAFLANLRRFPHLLESVRRRFGPKG